MTDAIEPSSVRVTGVERQDPALRKLARAFLALARHQLSQKKSVNEAQTAAEPPATEVGHG
ncbi:hypothetical protein [Lentzea aerocolonigenes]|uniref:hypothetical protein n=1 Tax=Lentzea aerocolonigenes TaxID=68170 RepID=UPI0012DC16FF|nr:hypothetical protein [Lentzea aerocolonigenes]